MPNTLPLSIVLGALPPNVLWTPQQLGDAIAQRLSIVTQGTFALFVAGSTEPSSNVGPWLKNNNTWYVWSDGLGAYEPQHLNQASLGYTIGANPPDPNIYQFWIETTLGGSPLSIRTFFGGAWVDVYTAVIGNYQTVAAFNAAIANYSTTAAMNAAISAAVGGVVFNTYPAQATIDVTPQSIPVDATSHKVIFESAPINPGVAPWNVVASRYVAPADGVYQVSASPQVDNATGVAATMQALIAVYKNGVDTGLGSGDFTPSPNGNRWAPSFGGLLVQLLTNDYLEIWMQFDDGTNTGAVDLTTIDFAVTRVSA